MELFTLSDCIERINQILNYPSLSYSDISHFFDQAISELNTELHIGLRPISNIYKEASYSTAYAEHCIMLSSQPTSEAITNSDTLSYDSSTGLITYVDSNGVSRTTSVLYGIYATFDNDTKQPIRQMYRTVKVGGAIFWSPYEYVPEREINLADYLSTDWIILFLIPYVCFKYAVRNGDSGALYSEEFQQGFQQLQNSYDVPSFVNLVEYAGKPAYTEDVKNHIDNLKIQIPTRAIYDDMKTSRTIRAEYGGMYDRGGWGY